MEGVSNTKTKSTGREVVLALCFHISSGRVRTNQNIHLVAVRKKRIFSNHCETLASVSPLLLSYTHPPLSLPNYTIPSRPFIAYPLQFHYSSYHLSAPRTPGFHPIRTYHLPHPHPHRSRDSRSPKHILQPHPTLPGLYSRGGRGGKGGSADVCNG